MVEIVIALITSVSGILTIILNAKLNASTKSRSKIEEARKVEMEALQKQISEININMADIKYRQEKFENCTKATLRDAILKRCNQLLCIGKCTMSDIRELNEIAQPYFDANGNGIVKKLYDRVLELPITEDEDEWHKYAE